MKKASTHTFFLYVIVLVHGSWAVSAQDGRTFLHYNYHVTSVLSQKNISDTDWVTIDDRFIQSQSYQQPELKTESKPDTTSHSDDGLPAPHYHWHPMDWGYSNAPQSN